VLWIRQKYVVFCVDIWGSELHLRLFGTYILPIDKLSNVQKSHLQLANCRKWTWANKFRTDVSLNFKFSNSHVYTCHEGLSEKEILNCKNTGPEYGYRESNFTVNHTFKLKGWYFLKHVCTNFSSFTGITTHCGFWPFPWFSSIPFFPYITFSILLFPSFVYLLQGPRSIFSLVFLWFSHLLVST